MSLPDKALALWRESFVGEPAVLAQSPGRVNLIGEHTDYNRGLVMPAAIDRRVIVLARVSREERIVSGQLRHEGSPERAGRWQRYVVACRAALEDRGLPAPSLDAVVWSSLPRGSGLSSSAALELAFLHAWNQIGDLRLDQTELADLAWTAETKHVGVRVGRMDQLACSLGVADHVLYIDFDTNAVDPVPVPDGVSIAILDTRKRRSLAAGKYNERVEECRRAVEAVSRFRPVESLREASMDDLARARQEGLDAVSYRRARHVLRENQRVEECKEALLRADFAHIRQLFEASHASLKEDYEVTTPELDAMARSARSAPGCLGARMTGAGFGGCCVALVESDAFRAFKASTCTSYGIYGHPTPQVFATHATAGASSESI